MTSEIQPWYLSTRAALWVQRPVLSSGLGAFAVLGGLVTLVGWIAGLPRLTDWYGAGITMFPNTAIATICVGAALVVLASRSRLRSAATTALGAVAGFLGVATLVEHIFGVDLAIDALFVRTEWGERGAVAPGRMGPPACVSFTLLALALILLVRGPRARRAAARLAVAVIVVVSVPLVGFLFRADTLYAAPHVTAIAMQTATLILALALGLIASVPEKGAVRALLEDSAAGEMARRSLPFIIAIPIIAGWLRMRGEDAGLYQSALGTSMLAIALVLMLCAVLWRGVRAVGIREIAQERTERMLVEREMEQRRARADAENALRVKDEFLATLSHELGTPLNAIVGWAYLLKKGANDPETVRRSVEVIERNAKLQAQLISDLLDMSRIVTGKMRCELQRLELDAVVRAAADSVRPAADAKGVRIECAPDPAGSSVIGDPSRLQQVIWNLLSNAVKFTPQGGRVDIVQSRAGDRVQARVTDTGEGIAADFLPHVFERFRQADGSATRRHGGLGIGLALAKELVELHGGSVRAASNGPGTGATFTVELPLAPAR